MIYVLVKCSSRVFLYQVLVCVNWFLRSCSSKAPHLRPLADVVPWVSVLQKGIVHTGYFSVSEFLSRIFCCWSSKWTWNNMQEWWHFIAPPLSECDDYHMIHCWQEYVCSLCFSQQWSGLIFPNQEALIFFPVTFYSRGKSFYCQIKPRSSQSCTPCPVLGAFWEDYMQNKCPWSQEKVAAAGRDYAVLCSNSAGCNLCVQKPHFSSEMWEGLNSTFCLSLETELKWQM